MVKNIATVSYKNINFLKIKSDYDCKSYTESSHFNSES